MAVTLNGRMFCAVPLKARGMLVQDKTRQDKARRSMTSRLKMPRSHLTFRNVIEWKLFFLRWRSLQRVPLRSSGYLEAVKIFFCSSRELQKTRNVGSASFVRQAIVSRGYAAPDRN